VGYIIWDTSNRWFNKATLSKQQNGFRPGHSSQDCIRALIDAIEDSHQHKKELHLAYIDLSKAYDSVSHEALLKVLAMHGVNEGFIRAISNIYLDSTVQLKINNTLTEKIQYSKGVRQGDGLSPLLFIIFLTH